MDRLLLFHVTLLLSGDDEKEIFFCGRYPVICFVFIYCQFDTHTNLKRQITICVRILATGNIFGAITFFADYGFYYLLQVSVNCFILCAIL